MKPNRLPILVWAVFYAIFCVYVLTSTPELPQRIASHFGVNGKADGWMTRETWQKTVFLFGTFFPLAMPLIMGLIRFIPDRFVNIPNRAYWLAPERKEQTLSRLSLFLWWDACLMQFFVFEIHRCTVLANRQIPAVLPNPEFGLSLFGFLAATGALMLWMLWPFLKEEIRVEI
jgi:eukaryotic-like serine/threonine-protein kinase